MPPISTVDGSGNGMPRAVAAYVATNSHAVARREAERSRRSVRCRSMSRQIPVDWLKRAADDLRPVGRINHANPRHTPSKAATDERRLPRPPSSIVAFNPRMPATRYPSREALSWNWRMCASPLDGPVTSFPAAAS